MNKILVALFGILIISNLSCTHTKGENKDTNSKTLVDSVIQTKTIDTSKILSDKSLTDIAKFIAGIQVDSTSTLYTLSQTAEWKKYRAETDSSWAKFNRLSAKITTWKNKELPATDEAFETLFYPFGGPDYLFANIFFPKAKNFILMGLESPGAAPQIVDTKKDELKGMLNLYKKAIEDVIQLSFFRTVDMKEELKTQAIDGTTPIIMLFLARAGKEIVSVTPSTLDNEGKMVPSIAKDRVSVDIAFKNPEDSVVRHVYYLSTNVADPTLSKNIPYMKYLENIDPQSKSFIKSATYLMHKSYFSIIRNTVLNKSLMVLQDNSGIAYKFYDKTKWDITLYGTYENPIPLFKDFYESDLSEAYKKASKPVDFRYGYNRKSNFLLAQKKK